MSERKENTSVKATIQKLGSYLSSMVMPNIGAFIAWGIITALFIPDGWLPNAQLANLVGPMRDYLLPILIGYTGGSMVYGQRGAVTGAIATMGAVVGASEIVTGSATVPMFIGAMALGPLGGWVIKKFDEKAQDHIPAGFEMLINNFSIGILGFFLTLLGFYAVGPFVSGMTTIFASGVDWIIAQGLLPLANIFIEPAKILFLNNAINHGILTPLGSQQVTEIGHSILFLLEANPGPGLGILLAFSVFGKGSAKASAPGAIIIHFLGGIHEIYFPYVMMKPLLFLAVIAGGVSGTFTFQMLGAALTGPASPGSIIAILGMTAPGSYIGVIGGVLVGAVVSFLVASAILKMDKKADDDFEAAQKSIKDAKAQAKGQATSSTTGTASTTPADLSVDNIDRIIFACDAGMGSSAMGASLLRKKAKALGLDMSITNTAISKLEDKSGTLVITQEELTDRAKKQAPSSAHVSVGNFLDGDRYDEILAEMQSNNAEAQTTSTSVATPMQNDVAAHGDIQLIQVPYAADASSAAVMGASILRNKLKKANLDITAEAVPFAELTNAAQVLVITNAVTDAEARAKAPNASFEQIEKLYEEKQFNQVIDKLK
jgi:PTS system mannitol-specific IIC component